MKRLTMIAAGLAVLVLATGAVLAQPGNAPVDVGAQTDDHGQAADHGQSADHQMTDTDHTNETAETESDDAGSQAAAAPEADAHGNDAEQGPPVEMPTPVPDRVADIHEMIQKFIDDDLEGSLGQSLQDVFGHGGDQTVSEHANENATATGQQDG